MQLCLLSFPIEYELVYQGFYLEQSCQVKWPGQTVFAGRRRSTEWYERDMFQMDDAESCWSCSHSCSERPYSVSMKDGKIYACLVDVPTKPPTSRDAIYTIIFASCISCGLCKPSPPAFLYSYKLPYCFQRSLKKKGTDLFIINSY